MDWCPMRSVNTMRSSAPNMASTFCLCGDAKMWIVPWSRSLAHTAGVTSLYNRCRLTWKRFASKFNMHVRTNVILCYRWNYLRYSICFCFPYCVINSIMIWLWKEETFLLLRWTVPSKSILSLCKNIPKHQEHAVFGVPCPDPGQVFHGTQTERREKCRHSPTPEGTSIEPWATGGMAPQQIKTLYTKILDLDHRLERVQSSSIDQELGLQLTERVSYNGILIWKVDEFERRWKEAMEGVTLSLSNPLFSLQV